MFYSFADSGTIDNLFQVSLYYHLLANISQISPCIISHPFHILNNQASTLLPLFYLNLSQIFLLLLHKVFRAEQYQLHSYLQGPLSRTLRMSHYFSQGSAKTQIIGNFIMPVKRTGIIRMPMSIKYSILR